MDANKITVELFDDGWNEDQLLEELTDLLRDADVDVYVADCGIGDYEYWGSKGRDVDIRVEEVTGDDVEIELILEGNPVSEVMCEMRGEILANLPTISDHRIEGDDERGKSYEAEFKWVPLVKDGKILYQIVY